MMRRDDRPQRTLLPAALCAGALTLAGPAVAAPTLPGELTNPLEDPEDCAECHTFPNTGAHVGEPLVAPIAWQGTLMANAARDPVFWAGVAIAAQDQEAPGETEECVRCHVPRAFLGGRGQVIAIDDLEFGDRSGIDCDFCHRQIADDDPEATIGGAHYVLDDALGIDGKVPKRGPWSYEPGEEPLHSWAVGEFLASAEACGICHDVTTPRPRVDADGQPTGALFNEQRTYSEWRNSAYGPGGSAHETCQGCHMPAVADVAGCGKYMSEGLLHATGGRRHDLGGGNRFMIEVLRALYGDAGTGEIADVFFEIAGANIDATLAEAATLTVEAPPAVDLAAGLDLAVTVTNKSGHKLPTGYSEGRVMWLEVIARYGGEAIYTSGRWLAGEGPEDDPQVRRYEAIAVEYSTDETFHLLRNNFWRVDTRIPPRGLVPDPETDPVGERYSLTEDGVWPHSDRATYTFPPAVVVDQTPEDTGDDRLMVQIRLLYLVNTPAYLEFLVDTNTTNSAGAVAFDAFEALGGVEPAVVSESLLELPLTGLLPPTAETMGETMGETTGQTTGQTTGDTAGQTPGDTAASATAGSGSQSAGDGDTGDSEGGCGCTSSPRSGGSGLLAELGLLGLLAGRRRRRRPQG